MRRRFILLVIGALVATLLGATPTASADPKPEAGPTVYVGQLTHEQLKQLSDLSLDRSDLSVRQGATKDTTSVEVVLPGARLQNSRPRAEAGGEEGRRRHRVEAAQQ